MTLDGTVPNRYEQLVAEQDARDIVGVAWVTNNLSIRAPRRDDESIRMDVESALYADTLLFDNDIKTSLKSGVVTLKGSVNSWYEKLHAGDVAGSIRGVKSVVNDLAVNYLRVRTDPELTKMIKDRLASNWATMWVTDRIHVAVKNGIATLTGDVFSWAERSEAGLVSFKTPGIWTVDNRLTVAGYKYPWDEWVYKGPLTYDPLNLTSKYYYYLSYPYILRIH